MLTRLEDHVPDYVKTNPNAVKLIAVLQGMIDYAEDNIDVYGRSFNPLTADTVEWVRNYIDDFGGDYLIETAKTALECLYNKKNYHYSKKGTGFALGSVINCYLAQYGECAVDQITYYRGYPLLHFYTLSGGVLPNGQDLADELDSLYDPPKFIPTLLADTWVTHYKSCVVHIYCISGTVPTDVIEFLKYVVYTFSPMLEDLGSVTVQQEDTLQSGGTQQTLPDYPIIVNGGVDDVLIAKLLLEYGGSD